MTRQTLHWTLALALLIALGSSASAQRAVPTPVLDPDGPGLWWDGSGDSTHHGNFHDTNAYVDYTTEPGIAIKPWGKSHQYFTGNAAGNTRIPMGTDKDWVARFVMRNDRTDARYVDPIEAMVPLNSGGPIHGTLIWLRWHSTDAYVEYGSPRETVTVPMTNDGLFHTLIWHYKEANSRIDLYVDDELLKEDMGSFDGSPYDVNRFILRGASFDDVIVGVPEPGLLGGDANGDGVVDVADLGVLGANFNQSNMAFADGDFNDDGLVDVADLGILGANWTASQASGNASVLVPEPTSVLVFVISAAGLLRRGARSLSDHYGAGTSQAARGRT